MSNTEPTTPTPRPDPEEALRTQIAALTVDEREQQLRDYRQRSLKGSLTFDEQRYALALIGSLRGPGSKPKTKKAKTPVAISDDELFG